MTTAIPKDRLGYPMYPTITRLSKRATVTVCDDSKHYYVNVYDTAKGTRETIADNLTQGVAERIAKHLNEAQLLIDKYSY